MPTKAHETKKKYLVYAAWMAATAIAQCHSLRQVLLGRPLVDWEPDIGS